MPTATTHARLHQLLTDLYPPPCRHGPEANKFRTLRLVDEATNGSSVVAFSKYNENGYQFTLATQRTYWVSWVGDVRVDQNAMTLHKMDKSDNSSYVYIRSKFLQVSGVAVEGSCVAFQLATGSPLPLLPLALHTPAATHQARLQPLCCR